MSELSMVPVHIPEKEGGNKAGKEIKPRTEGKKGNTV